MAEPAPIDILTEPLLDAAEAAALLNVGGPDAIYELCRSRGLPYVAVGKRQKRFTRSGLAGWVQENTYGQRAA